MPSLRERGSSIAVVEAQPLLADSLVRLLETTDDLTCAGSWACFPTASGAWDEVRPDAAIVDPMLLGDDPVRTLDTLAAGTDVPLLLFSRETPLDYVHLLVAAGARGVIGTEARGASVLDATRSVVALRRYVPPELRAEILELMLAAQPPPYLALSPRERQVVRHAASGATVAVIAKSLIVSESTVKTHLRAAYEKLDVHDRASAAAMLMRIGMPARAGAAPGFLAEARAG